MHLDKNRNLAAEPSDFLDQSTCTGDVGVIKFAFENPVVTQGATFRILITYELLRTRPTVNAGVSLERFELSRASI